MEWSRRTLRPLRPRQAASGLGRRDRPESGRGELSKLYDDLAALDKKIADRWKIRTRDNDKHVLSVDDVDFILADLVKSARTTDITEKQAATARFGLWVKFSRRR